MTAATATPKKHGHNDDQVQPDQSVSQKPTKKARAAKPVTTAEAKVKPEKKEKKEKAEKKVKKFDRAGEEAKLVAKYINREIVVGSLRQACEVERFGKKRSVEIRCDCGQKRRIATSDLYQVGQCVKCADATKKPKKAKKAKKEKVTKE